MMYLDKKILYIEIYEPEVPEMGYLSG